MRTVGMIGLGLLGSAIAERLLAAGFEVVGYDVEDARRQALTGVGGKAVDDAGDVFAKCVPVLLSLPNSGVVAQVVSATGESIRPDALVIDTTTGDPQAAEAMGRQLAARGVRYLDATVAGSSEQARQGEVLVMVGGEESAFTAASAVLATFAADAFYVGPWGAGSRMKLVVNLVLGLNRAVLAEGLTLAEALGLDPQRALELLQASAAYSKVMDIKGQKMLDRDFQPQARLSQHLKDVRLILEAGGRTGAALPLSSLHRELLERAEVAGWGDADNSAVIEVFRGGKKNP
jgi:3-hydroxyisobutyrate dehydrogenase-like beta-hydroxyacid dehydrogenase